MDVNFLHDALDSDKHTIRQFFHGDKNEFAFAHRRIGSKVFLHSLVRTNQIEARDGRMHIVQ